jgi:hypothetical protein
VELAPTRVNMVAPGFVDTPLSASLLGDQLDARREELRATLPIGGVVGPADVAALAVHLMTDTALTGATYDGGAAATAAWPRANSAQQQAELGHADQREPRQEWRRTDRWPCSSPCPRPAAG